jgi:hypothetical protein
LGSGPGCEDEASRQKEDRCQKDGGEYGTSKDGEKDCAS